MRRRRVLDTDLRRTAWRIGLQTAGLVMVCLLFVGGVAYGAVVRGQEQQLTQSLSDAAATAGLGQPNDRDHDHDLSQPRGGIQFAVRDQRGLRTSTDLPVGMPDLAVMNLVMTSRKTDQRTVQLASGAYEVLTLVRGDDVVQVMASRFEQSQERERALGALAVAALAGLVVATLAGAVLARRAVRPMAEALELQRRFVADAGHELRTPLTLLSTRAQFLARRLRSHPDAAQDDRTVRDTEGMVADTASLTAILEELLLAADVRTPMPHEAVDLTELVTLAVAAAQARAEQAGVTLTLDAPADPVSLKAGTSAALSRAVTALIDNALDHTGSSVAVSLSIDGRSAVVQVSDDGPGIPTQTLPRMFERFASGRPEPADHQARRHFGLGLALVSEIANRHGGTVTAANRQGPTPGAILRFALPR